MFHKVGRTAILDGHETMSPRSRSTHTEAVAAFHDADSLQAAIDDLLSHGFNRADLSLLASEGSVERELGHAYLKAEELEDDPNVPTVAYVSPEAIGDAEGGLVGALVYVGAVAAVGAVVASGGTLGGVIAAAVMAGGAGGFIGAALATLIGEAHANRIQEQLDHGALLLWVRTWDKDHEARAVEILSRHSAHDVHLHELPPSAA
jgi:outer membrane lipoprotein SlyB